MYSIRNYEYDCSEKCRYGKHGNLITAALTKRNIPDDKLAAYIAKVCRNFKNILDDMGRSAVHMTSSVDRYRILAWLINQKPMIDSRDLENGATPLHRAIYYGCIDSAVLLLRSGAKLETLDDDKRSPLQNVCRSRDDIANANVPSYNDLVVWGSNKNYNLGLGNEEDINSPQAINFFRKERISVELVAMGAYHSLFLDKNSHLYAVGHGKGGRLGNGTEISMPLPKKVKVPTKSQGDHIICISVSRKHSLLLTNCSLVFAAGLNEDLQLGVRGAGEKLNTFKQVVTFQDLGVEGLLRVVAQDFHSFAYSEKCFYVWGTNHGQFGGDATIKAIPFPKQIKLPPRTSIQFVEGNNYATVCYTKDNLILLFYNYQMKIIKPVNYDRLKSISIVGGDNIKLAKGSATALKMLLLTVTNSIYLWYEKTQNYYQCTFSQYKISQIDKIIYKANQVFLLSQGDVYMGKCFQYSVSNHHSEMKNIRKNSAANWNHNDKNRTEVNKDQIIRIDLKHLANVDRAVDLFCNDDFSAFCVLQESSRKYFKLPYLHSIEYSFKKLLNDANSLDSIHDVVFHVDGEEFCAHKLILCARSSVLGEIVQKSTEKHISLNYQGLTAKMFEVILKFIYTNYRPTEDDIDSFQQSLGPDCPSERSIIYELFLRFVEGFKLTGLVEFLQRSLNESPYILSNNGYDSKLRFNRLRLKDFPSLYDIRIICSDGIEIAVHKCILVSRLEYFDMMFTHSWAEKTTINLSTVPAEYMKVIIDFLYTLDIEAFRRKNFSEEYLYNMIVFCDQFFIENLRKVCEVLILERISVRKCGDMLEFATFYNCNMLKNGCLDFICQNLARVLTRKSLEFVDPENLKCINKHYRTMFKNIFDYRTITPASEAVDDETLLSFVEDFKIDLDSYLDRNEEILSLKDQIPLKLQLKDSKIKQSTRQHEREAISTMLGELSLNDAAEAKEKVESNSKYLQDIKTASQKLQNEAEYWLKVVNKPEVKRKIPPLSPFVPKTESKEKGELVNLVQEKIPTSNFDTCQTASESLLSKKTYNFILEAFESPRSKEKMSQKQRKRLLSESGGSNSADQAKAVAVPQEIPPVSPAIISNAWGVAASSLSPDSDELSLNSLAHSLREKGSVSSSSQSRKCHASVASFSEIVENERKQRDYYQRMRNKSLALTQIEEEAISELRAFYNADNTDDEIITVERKSIPQTINFATWPKS